MREVEELTIGNKFKEFRIVLNTVNDKEAKDKLLEAAIKEGIVLEYLYLNMESALLPSNMSTVYRYRMIVNYE